MENSVVILGAAALQVPLIKYIKAKGYNTIVVSIPGNYPGFSLADKCVYCDIRDADSIIEAISGDIIKAVITDETDIAVPAVAELSRRLNLPGNDPEVAIAYSNKYKMRQECLNAGVLIPKFIHVSKVSEIENLENIISFPAIMKPEDNQGSRGIYKVNSRLDIIKYFEDSAHYSRTGNVIIEEYFHGQEYVLEGFVLDGKYMCFGVGQRKYFNLEGLLIPCQTIFPSNLSDKLIKKLIDAECKLHSHLKPSFGMIHSEYLVNPDSEDYILVETALRGGGVYISSHLVPLYSGINNYDMLFRCAMGEKISLSRIEESRKNAACAYVCFTLPEGEIVSVCGVDDIKKIPSVKVCDVDALSIGTHTERMLNKTQRLGPIIVAAENREEIEYEIDKIQKTLVIKVKTPSGLLEDIIWS